MSIFNSDENEIAVIAIGNVQCFTGREWDGELKINYYRNRFYDPKIGRFLSVDPIGIHSGDLNFYRYVRNNPIVYKDPFGLWKFYGNLGGPGWSGGQKLPLTDLTENQRSKLPDPIDPMDALFYEHDYCYMDAELKMKQITDNPCSPIDDKRRAMTIYALDKSNCNSKLGHRL